MADIIVGIILILLIGGAVAYIVKEKKKGTKCIGCPAAEAAPTAGNAVRSTDKKSIRYGQMSAGWIFYAGLLCCCVGSCVVCSRAFGCGCRVFLGGEHGPVASCVAYHNDRIFHVDGCAERFRYQHAI